MALFVSGCVASKVEHFQKYTPNPSRRPHIARGAIEEYYSLSWEPYLLFCTVGIIPQYHYVVYEKSSGGFEKRSDIFGWVALALPLVSSWKYGPVPEAAKANKAPQTEAGGSSVRVPYRSPGAAGL